MMAKILFSLAKASENNLCEVKGESPLTKQGEEDLKNVR